MKELIIEITESAWEHNEPLANIQARLYSELNKYFEIPNTNTEFFVGENIKRILPNRNRGLEKHPRTTLNKIYTIERIKENYLNMKIAIGIRADNGYLNWYSAKTISNEFIKIKPPENIEDK